MSKWIASLILILASTQAFAQYQTSSYDDYKVTILTWCEGNIVMTNDAQGNPYEVRNCDDYAQTCRTFDRYTRWGVTYAAVCKAPQN